MWDSKTCKVMACRNFDIGSSVCSPQKKLKLRFVWTFIQYGITLTLKVIVQLVWSNQLINEFYVSQKQRSKDVKNCEMFDREGLMHDQSSTPWPMSITFIPRFEMPTSLRTRCKYICVRWANPLKQVWKLGDFFGFREKSFLPLPRERQASVSLRCGSRKRGLKKNFLFSEH